MIQNDEVRQRALINAGRCWLRSDPAAASEWLRGSDLSDALMPNITNPQSYGDEVRGGFEAGGGGGR